MYRILIATSGYYYVQKRTHSGDWVKANPGFFPTRKGAREWVRREKACTGSCGSCDCRAKVVEYV